MMQTFTGNSNLDISGMLGRLTGGQGSGGIGGLLGKVFG